MKKILISGITGFVGSNLKSYLNDTNIIGISRNPCKTENTISYEEINKSHLNESLAFIHLAGKAHDVRNKTANEEYYQVNTDLSIHLFNTFLKSNCEIFIYMSTVKAVADTVDGILYEDAVPNPITPYGKSKLKAENYICSQPLPRNKKVYILRPCMIHGPHNKGNLNLLYSIIKKGIPYPFGAYKNTRSFLSVDNLCFVIKKIIDLKPNSGIYNIADNETISTKQLVKIIGEVINKPVKIYNIPKKIVFLIALTGNLLRLPLNTERLIKLTENYCVSNTKIKKALNIELPLNTEEGIKKTISYLDKVL